MMEDPTRYKQEVNKMKEYKDEIKYGLTNNLIN